MSLKDKASLIFKPSRYKSGKAYSFRGGDFSTVGSSIRTRVNSQGLIEDVSAGVPRITYDPSDLTKCPAISFEPARTNYSPYSHATSGLDINSENNITFQNDAAVSPDGTLNAFKATYDGTGYSYFRRFNYGGWGVFSVFVKKGNWRYIGIRVGYSSGVHSVFDLDEGKFTTSLTGHTYTVKEYPNGWYRISAAVDSSTYQTNIQSICFCGSATAGTELPSGVLAGSYMYVYGWQTEASLLVPTSLIKTTGSSVTRSVSHAVATVPDHTAGTFFLDIETTTAAPIVYGAVGGATGYQNAVIIENSGSLNNLVVAVYNGGTSQLSGFPAFAHNPFQKIKIAVTYKTDEIKIYINGVLYHSDTSASIPTLDGVGLARWVVSPVDARAFSTIYEAIQSDIVLTESEAIALTSYDDYQELVDRNDLTWESPTITNNRLTALKEL